MLTWFHTLFDGEKLDLPYPAVKVGTTTYIFSPMSKLEELRTLVAPTPPEPPIMPVIALDSPMPDDPPRGRWLCLSAKSLSYYDYRRPSDKNHPITLDAFNETVRAMKLLDNANPSGQEK